MLVLTGPLVQSPVLSGDRIGAFTPARRPTARSVLQSWTGTACRFWLYCWSPPCDSSPADAGLATSMAPRATPAMAPAAVILRSMAISPDRVSVRSPWSCGTPAGVHGSPRKLFEALVDTAGKVVRLPGSGPGTGAPCPIADGVENCGSDCRFRSGDGFTGGWSGRARTSAGRTRLLVDVGAHGTVGAVTGAVGRQDRRVHADQADSGVEVAGLDRHGLQVLVVLLVATVRLVAAVTGGVGRASVRERG